MCDEASFADEIEWLKQPQTLSRRGFAGMAGMAGLLAMLPAPAHAMDVAEQDVSVSTPDGQADCYFVHPAKGKHPAVLIWPDIFGLRPAFRQMAKRLAQSGYAVLVVNPYYRSIKAPVLPEGADPRAPENWEKVRMHAMKLSPLTAETDAKALIAFLDTQKAVNRKRGVGTTGYCMGGPLVMRTAAAVPSRVRAIASFHGGGLATDKPESPHLLIPKMKASVLVAVAENDDLKNPQEKETLRTAFAAAKRKAEIEVYAGAMHGWCPPDSKAYNEALAERAWARLLVLLKSSL